MPARKKLVAAGSGNGEMSFEDANGNALARLIR
jgi:hypothetical protein